MNAEKYMQLICKIAIYKDSTNQLKDWVNELATWVSAGTKHLIPNKVQIEYNYFVAFENFDECIWTTDYFCRQVKNRSLELPMIPNYFHASNSVYNFARVFQPYCLDAWTNSVTSIEEISNQIFKFISEIGDS